MLLNDFVNVAERGFARLRNRAGAIIAGREFEEQSVVHTEGWVKIVCRERGKLVKRNCREGHNIWTNTGREYLSLLMSIASVAPSLGYHRSDRIAFIGVGTGSQLETPSVTSLVTPVRFTGNDFLAELDVPDFPLLTTRTTVRFKRTFSEQHISITANQRVNISEMGLFTNGNPASSPPFKSPADAEMEGLETVPADYTRSRSIDDAGEQAPMAYKSFEPIGKTDSMQLEVSWEIRF